MRTFELTERFALIIAPFERSCLLIDASVFGFWCSPDSGAPLTSYESGCSLHLVCLWKTVWNSSRAPSIS